MKLRKLVVDTENPKSSVFATILMVLAIINDATVEFGSVIGLSDRTITVITTIVVAATFIYNELVRKGIIDGEKSLLKKALSIFGI